MTTKSRLYLALQAAVCIALTVWLSVSAIGVFREGSARKALNPMESVFTPEAAARAFAPIAPLFFVGLGLLAAGLILGVKDENAEKPAPNERRRKAPPASRALPRSFVSPALQRWQNRLPWVGRGVFALCMVPVTLYLLDPSHFPGDDLEAMFLNLLRVLLPWTAAGLGTLAVTSVLQDKSIPRQTQKPLRAASGLAPAGKPRSSARLQTALIAAAVALIILGIFNGSALDVLYKAITICTECIGLG